MSSLVGGIGGALIGGAIIGGGASLIGGKMAADSAESAANTAANAQGEATDEQLGFQREQLDYLKELDKLPRQYREEALNQLGGAYTGDQSQQQTFMDRARQSPLYNQIMGNRQSGEEAIMRNASATGGLRSGNVQSNMYQYNTELQNDALLQSYNQQLQGLSGLAGMQGYGNQIASTMGDMGITAGTGIAAAGQAQAQGQVASGQAWQQGIQGASGAIGSGIGNYMFGKGMGIF